MTGKDHEANLLSDKTDGISYAASIESLKTYSDASQAQMRQKVPILIDGKNPHDRLFVAALDGTGNDVTKDPLHATNVAKIQAQIQKLNVRGNTHIRSGYVPGPGTQDKLIPRTLDGMTGATYDQRTEEMYKKFIDQAWQWKREDPEARISIAELGFSRGSEQAAGLARLIETRGIQDPTSAVYTRGSNGLINHVEYSKPPLVPPGTTAQIVGLFDPVGTGDPIKNHDRRLPPSVISGFQITAEDERRGLFKSDRIMKPGQSADGRFLSVNVAGAHSDVGGGYLRNGIAIHSGNLMIDFLNSASGTPFLTKEALPTDPTLTVIHRSEQSNLLYKFYPKIDRNTSDGFNDLLVPKSQIGKVGDAYHAQPGNEPIRQQFEHQYTKIGAMPLSPPALGAAPDNLSSRLDSLLAAGSSGDQAAMRAGTQALANNDTARLMQSDAVVTVNRQGQAAIAPPTSLQQPPPKAPDQQQPDPSGAQR